MKHPLLAAAAAYAGGVMLGEWVPTDLALLLAVTAAAWMTAMVVARIRPLLLPPLFVLAGWTAMSLSNDVWSARDLREQIGERAEHLTLRGYLVDAPVIGPAHSARGAQWRTSARLDVTAVRRRSHWEPAYGRVAIATPGRIDESWHRGLPLEVTGVLAPPRGSAAPGLFNHRTHLRHLGIHYQLQSESTNDWRLALPSGTPPPRPPLDARFTRWARATLARGLPVEDDSLRLLWAMTLGWKPGLTDELSEPFLHSGTLHIFAISGLHVALIAEILLHLLRLFRIPRAGCGLIALPLLWFYTVATGWQPSAVRSAIMMSLVIGGWTLRRPPDLLNSLMAAALIILGLDPHQLFQTGFQLSFFVVLSIAVLLPPCEALRRRWIAPDPLLPEELRPRWRRWLDSPLRYLTLNATLSLAAWLGSVPLVAACFHLFTPVSLLANLLVVPVSGLALTSALGSLLCGDLLPGFSSCFNHGAWFWMQLMIRLSTWTASLPGASFPVPSPGLLLSLAWFVAVLGPAAGLLRHRTSRRVWTATLFTLAALWTVDHLRHRPETHLTILDAGGGDSLWIDAPGRREDLLVDCGDAFNAPYRLLPFLQAQGLGSLPRVLLTHGDTRHISGFLPLVEQINVRRLSLSPVRQRSPALDHVLEAATERDIPLERVHVGRTIASWQVLHPAANDRPRRADDHAIVLQRVWHGVPVLLCSDLGAEGQEQLIKRSGLARDGILIAGMPNGEEPLSPALLHAVQPRLIILSCGRFPSAERPSWPLRVRLHRTGIPLLFIADSGTASLTIGPRGWRIRTMAGELLEGTPSLEPLLPPHPGPGASTGGTSPAPPHPSSSSSAETSPSSSSPPASG